MVTTRSTRTIRPQQPTDSPAASLPVETLVQILACALEGLEPWERQQTRVAFSKICRGWYDVAQDGKECAVNDTRMAERLTVSLNKRDAGRHVKVLGLRVEPKGAGRGPRAAELPQACSRLEHLELSGFYGKSLGSSADESPLGKPLSAALFSLSNLKRFELCGYGLELFEWEPIKLLASWTHLSSLYLNGVCFKPSINAPAALAAAPTTALTNLCFSIPYARNGIVLAKLIKASAPTLLRLELENVASDGLGSMPAEVVSALLAVAPRLHSLVVKNMAGLPEFLRSGTPLDAILTALVEIRALDLCAHGYSLSTILPGLQNLQHLSSLTVVNNTLYANARPSRLLSSTAAVDFLLNSASIRTLALPRQLSASWTSGETETVKRTAQIKGVKLVWA